MANAGDIAVDGTGGVWVANAEGDGSNAQIYHALPGGSLQLVTGGPATYYKPHITATGDGKAYVTTSDYSASPYLSDVYKFSGANTSKVTLASSKLTNSAIFDLAVDRCYTTCAVAPPGTGGGGGGPTGKTASPLKSTPKTAKVTKAGLTFKLTCRTDCTVSVSGKLVYAKAKKKKTQEGVGRGLHEAAHHQGQAEGRQDQDGGHQALEGPAQGDQEGQEEEAQDHREPEAQGHAQGRQGHDQVAQAQGQVTEPLHAPPDLT